MGIGEGNLSLIEKLKDKDWHVRMMAAKELGEIRDLHAVDPLILCLKDEDWGVRSDAARALGKIRDLCAIEPLLTCLKYEENNKVLAEAKTALGRIKKRWIK